jgi:hypothetical protein
MSLNIDHQRNRITQDGSGVWRDLTADIVAKNSGVGAPTWATGIGGSMGAYSFSVNDFVDICFHIDHDYLPSSSIFLHAHWTTNGTNTQPVNWQFTYTIAKGHNQSNLVPAGTIITAQQAAHGTAWRHMITETAAISSAELEPDSIVWVNVKRITNGATENTDTVYLLTADVHYQAVYLGTKNKSPNFYT